MHEHFDASQIGKKTHRQLLHMFNQQEQGSYISMHALRAVHLVRINTPTKMPYL